MFEHFVNKTYSIEFYNNLEIYYYMIPTIIIFHNNKIKNRIDEKYIS